MSVRTTRIAVETLAFTSLVNIIHESLSNLIPMSVQEETICGML